MTAEPGKKTFQTIKNNLVLININKITAKPFSMNLIKFD